MGRKTKDKTIIIGNSAAGLSALEAFRNHDKRSNILLVDKEAILPYSRMILPYFIKGEIKKENLCLRGKDYYKRLNVKPSLGKEVQSIDTRSGSIVFDSGKREPFDSLLIATGASPNLPQIEQSSPEDILVLRNLLHAGYLKKMRPRTQRILFLGGGLVSLQTLQAMFKAGGQYTVVVKSDRILSQTLDREASEIAERHLREMGIQIIKGRDVVRLKQENHAKIAILDNGEEIETDLIFAGKGIKPNTFFLKGSGVKIQDGILVDEYGETNVEGIYAAGDVARTTDFFSDEKVHYGLWPSAVEQGEIAGKNMAGLKESYSGNLRMNVTQIFGMPIVSIGDFGSKRVAEVLRTKDERKNVYRKLCLDDRGTLIGAILVNEAEDLGIIQGFIKGKRKADVLRTHSIWKTSIRYGFVYKNILQGRL